MLNFDLNWTTRVIGAVITNANGAPPLVKGVATLALLIFSAYQVSACNKRRVKVVPQAEKAVNSQHKENRSILNELLETDDPQRFLKDLDFLTTHLQKLKEEDFLTDTQLLSLIAMIEKASILPLDDSENNRLTNLINLIIRRKKEFPPAAQSFLLSLTYKDPENFRDRICKAVRDGQVFLPHKGVEAMRLFLIKLQQFGGAEQFDTFLMNSGFIVQRDLSEKILERAYTSDPLGDHDEDIAYAKMAFYFANPRYVPAPEVDKWKRAIEKVSEPLLRRSPGYIVSTVLKFQHELLMPILEKALLLCSPEEFLESFSEIVSLEFTTEVTDRILSRLSSIKLWDVTSLRDILRFLKKTKGGKLPHSEISAILRWIKAGPNPGDLADAYTTLSNFADAPVFLNHLPLRQDLKPFIKSILSVFSRWPEARLDKAQQEFYRPEDTESDQRLCAVESLSRKSLYAHFFPQAFTQISFEKWAPWNEELLGTLSMLKLVINGLDDQENSIFLKKNWQNFLDSIGDFELVYRKNQFHHFTTLVLHILKRLVQDSPHNEQQWLRNPECKSFFDSMLGRLYTVPDAYEYPSVLPLLGDLARSSPQLFHQTDISWTNIFEIIITPPGNPREAADSLNALAAIVKAVTGDDKSCKIKGEIPNKHFAELCKYPFSSLEEVALVLEAKQIFELYGITLPIRFDQPLPKKLMSRAEKGRALLRTS